MRGSDKNYRFSSKNDSVWIFKITRRSYFHHCLCYCFVANQLLKPLVGLLGIEYELKTQHILNVYFYCSSIIFVSRFIKYCTKRILSKSLPFQKFEKDETYHFPMYDGLASLAVTFNIELVKYIIHAFTSSRSMLTKSVTIHYSSKKYSLAQLSFNCLGTVYTKNNSTCCVKQKDILISRFISQE